MSTVLVFHIAFTGVGFLLIITFSRLCLTFCGVSIATLTVRCLLWHYVCCKMLYCCCCLSFFSINHISVVILRDLFTLTGDWVYSTYTYETACCRASSASCTTARAAWTCRASWTTAVIYFVEGGCYTRAAGKVADLLCTTVCLHVPQPVHQRHWCMCCWFIGNIELRDRQERELLCCLLSLAFMVNFTSHSEMTIIL